MIYKYIPGLRPTPMLAYYTEQNKEHFDNLIEESNFLVKREFITEGRHYWNMNSYVIITTNIVVSLAFVDFSTLLFLLRVINEEIFINLNDDEYLKVKDEINKLGGELEFVSDNSNLK